MIIRSIEKEELVNLVLIHVNNSSSYGSSADGSAGNNETDENGTNPFDQIKQTCQNLFTSFTDKLASGECLLDYYFTSSSFKFSYLRTFVILYSSWQKPS